MGNNFVFKEVILDVKELKSIRDYILKNENGVKQLGPDTYMGTSDNSLTGRHRWFNWLYHDTIGDILIPKIRNIFEKIDIEYPIGVQCWANTFRRGAGISKHHHGDWKFLCSNLFIDGPEDVGTYYYVDKSWKKYISTPGELTIFNSQLKHYVPKNETDDIRISMAMDIYPSGEWKAKDAWDEIEDNERRYMILNDE